MRVRSTGGKRGFTLVELMVAVSISVVIGLFVMSFTSALIEILRRSDARISLENEVAVALDIMARDLESAVFREGQGTMFAVDVQSLDDLKLLGLEGSGNHWEPGYSRDVGAVNFQPGANPDDDTYPSYTFGWGGSHLRFFTAAPAFNAVSYQIGRRASPADAKRDVYVLYRSVVGKHHTEREGLDITLGEYIDDDSVAPPEGEPDFGSSNEGFPGTVKKPNAKDYLIQDVVDFGVRLYVYDAGQQDSPDSPRGVRLIFPSSDNENLDALESQHYASTGLGEDYDLRFPDLVEIYVRALDSVGARELSEAELDNKGRSFEEIVSQHGRVFRRMVEVRARTF